MRLRMLADDGGIVLDAGLEFSVELGPFTAAIDGMGLRADLRFTPQGNLGLVDLDAGIQPPAGIGLSLNTAAITGSGYLFSKPQLHQYEGAMQLKCGQLLLAGLGVLNTRRPDGKPGYSLVVVISGEFPPVQLGLGFTLNGVGGLLGIHRSAQVEALRDGVRSGAIGSLLFPQRALENAPQLLSQLQRFFPQAEGRYLLGPMFKLGWGPVPMVAAELGLALEFPDPLRLLLFGQLHLGLPSLAKPVVDAHMDLLGVIDFDAGTVALDAALVDSRIAGYRIDGQAALRANWKNDTSFTFAIGGLHPRAQLPPGFPALQRVQINLSEGDNPRLRLEGYFALTSNTVQCGARLDACARVSKFSAEA